MKIFVEYVGEELMNIVTPKRILFAFIGLSLIIGSMIVSDYGISVDEPNEIRNALMSLSAYTVEGLRTPPEYHQLRINQHYGTALSMIYVLAEKYISPLLNVPVGTVAHYFYFLTFQVGVISFFYLAKRFMNDWSALGATLLFGTQPLLFGHAFVNIKDIPIMVGFIVVVTVGFYALDDLVKKGKKSNITISLNSIVKKSKRDWTEINKSNKKKFWLLNSSWVLLGGLYIILRQGVIKLITFLYQADTNTWWGDFFSSFAERSSVYPLELYINKSLILYGRLFVFLFLGLLVFQIFYSRRFFPELYKYLYNEFILPIRSQFNLGKIFQSSKNPMLLYAGIVSGIAISTRVISMLAGGMVGLYFILKLKEKAINPLMIYVFTSGLFSFITWPYLWVMGFSGIVRSFLVMKNFPWSSNLLFEGVLQQPKELPWYYLPKLIGIQFTEPIILFAVIGLIVGIISVIHNKIDSKGFIIILAWLFLPLGYVIRYNPTMYHNFRQFLFITAPLFILSGLAIEKIYIIWKSKIVSISMIVIPLVFSIISIIKLHPYQYIYYNQFVGGVEETFRNYEMDYWHLSYKEAFDFIKQESPNGANVLVWSGRIADEYSDENVKVYYQNDLIDGDYGLIGIEDMDYIIIPSAFNLDSNNMFSSEVVFEVIRDNAVLVKVLIP